MLISFVGVGFVASGNGGFSADLGGDGLALFSAATWAGYSVTGSATTRFTRASGEWVQPTADCTSTRVSPVR